RATPSRPAAARIFTSWRRIMSPVLLLSQGCNLTLSRRKLQGALPGAPAKGAGNQQLLKVALTLDQHMVVRLLRRDGFHLNGLAIDSAV
ncbi:hypothetical protein, partial [Ramlibacter sp. AN1133]|uniref:hypothetical protein n=1 Tax=Ramlibacter sp. AN1133 TaxID=3133429 RepID=UPI0030C414A2